MSNDRHQQGISGRNSHKKSRNLVRRMQKKPFLILQRSTFYPWRKNFKIILVIRRVAFLGL
jgi:hypothetical protein